MSGQAPKPSLKPSVPGEVRARWQRMLDLMATIFRVPAGLIVRVDEPGQEVFLVNSTGGDFFKKGAKFLPNSGLYCDKVIKEHTPLLIPDALNDPQWANSAGAERGITYYLGFPILWPDEDVFGALCIMDTRNNAQATQFQELLSEFRDLLEKDLHILVETRAREDLLTELQNHRNHLQQMVAERTAEIQRLNDQIQSENFFLRQEMKGSIEFSGIIGGSNAIQYVKYRIQQVARTRTTVLLTGETGTGKGLFARALHEASDRKDKLFVNVNCAGLPPNLIESELFGREKGAFTGSTGRQIGRFELADGGTLFLDEIGELPLDLQAKLLKVIEAGEFERLGSPHPVKVDVRIIASTNRHLEEQVKNGEFRKDLFYRLNVFPITIPPLRQRNEDIPLLVEFYAKRFARDHAKSIERISRRTMTALENYDWPGNVRELMNVVERAVIVSDGPVLRLVEPIESLPVGPEHRKEATHADTPDIKGLHDVERDHILHALQKTGWRIDGGRGAARALGINPSTMRARMKKMHIHRPR